MVPKWWNNDGTLLPYQEVRELQPTKMATWGGTLVAWGGTMVGAHHQKRSPLQSSHWTQVVNQNDPPPIPGGIVVRSMILTLILIMGYNYLILEVYLPVFVVSSMVFDTSTGSKGQLHPRVAEGKSPDLRDCRGLTSTVSQYPTGQSDTTLGIPLV